MKLSISNIAWDQEDDVEIFEEMQNLGYKGLEIAPTKIFPVEPYNNIKVACEWKNRVCNQYGFGISSIQSIWFGRKENLFSSIDEYNYLLDYTKKIIEFAGALECHNIVFGCPSNRRIDNNYEQNYHNAKEFFYQLSAGIRHDSKTRTSFDSEKLKKTIEKFSRRSDILIQFILDPTKEAAEKLEKLTDDRDATGTKSEAPLDIDPVLFDYFEACKISLEELLTAVSIQLLEERFPSLFALLGNDRSAQHVESLIREAKFHA